MLLKEEKDLLRQVYANVYARAWVDNQNLSPQLRVQVTLAEANNAIQVMMPQVSALSTKTRTIIGLP